MLDERQRDLAVDGNDAAEGALGIAGEGAVVGLGHVGGDGGTTGVLVLENHHAGLVELTHGVPGGLGVEEVIVGQRLALELLGAHERGLRGEERGVGGVETVDRGGLMRVLAVAQVLGLLELDGHRGGGGELTIGGEDRVGATGLGLGGEPGGNGAVIGSRGGVDLHLETAARLERGGTIVGAHLGEDRLVIGRVGNHGHGVGVLGSGAQHGRPPISMCSMASAKVTSGLATVFSNS